MYLGPGIVAQNAAQLLAALACREKKEEERERKRVEILSMVAIAICIDRLTLPWVAFSRPSLEYTPCTSHGPRINTRLWTRLRFSS